MIELGTEVKDKITDFKGIATARIEYITGCVRYELTPKVDKDGKCLDSCWFDESRLLIIEESSVKVPEPKGEIGGPGNVPPSMNP